MRNAYNTSILHGERTYVEEHMVTFLYSKIISQNFRTIFSSKFEEKGPSDQVVVEMNSTKACFTVSKERKFDTGCKQFQPTLIIIIS